MPDRRARILRFACLVLGGILAIELALFAVHATFSRGLKIPDLPSLRPGMEGGSNTNASGATNALKSSTNAASTNTAANTKTNSATTNSATARAAKTNALPGAVGSSNIVVAETTLA